MHKDLAVINSDKNTNNKERKGNNNETSRKQNTKNNKYIDASSSTLRKLRMSTQRKPEERN